MRGCGALRYSEIRGGGGAQSEVAGSRENKTSSATPFKVISGTKAAASELVRPKGSFTYRLKQSEKAALERT